MVAEPTKETSADLSPVKSEAQIAPAILGSQAVNLNSSAAEMANKWHVEESNRLTIQAVLDSGTWNTAQVEVRGSIDNTTWTLIETLTAIGLSTDIDVTDYRFIQIVVSVLEGAAGSARFYGYGKVVLTPFEVTNTEFPTKTEDGETKVQSSNDRLLEMAEIININLGIIIKYLSCMSDETFTEEDIKDE